MELAVTKMCSKERLGQGFVLHGYPATLEQAKQMNNKGFEVDIVIELLRNDDEADEWRSGRLVDT
jgi:adenylate kinase family enzyme